MKSYYKKNCKNYSLWKFDFGQRPLFVLCCWRGTFAGAQRRLLARVALQAATGRFVNDGAFFFIVRPSLHQNTIKNFFFYATQRHVKRIQRGRVGPGRRAQRSLATLRSLTTESHPLSSYSPLTEGRVITQKTCLRSSSPPLQTCLMSSSRLPPPDGDESTKIYTNDFVCFNGTVHN